MAYCPNCGAELKEGQRYCQGCGRAVGTDAPPMPPSQSDEPRRGVKKVVKVDRLDKIVGLILAVTIGVPLLLAIVWFMLQFFLGFFSGLLGF